MEDKKKKDNVEEGAQLAAINVANADTIDLHSRAAGEHVVAYTGYDGETGQQLKRSLSSIANSKVDPNNAETNLKQQAGFSAETKTVARRNADKILSGDKNKVTRTDDMQKQSDGKGNTVGGTNDQLYDCAEVDANGNYVEGSGSQLKYVGSSPKECTDKILSSKYDKYHDNDVPIEVPSDYYDDVKKELALKRQRVEKQLQSAKERGDKEVYEKKKAQLEKINKADKLLKKGKVSSKEAMEARTNPMLSTAKDVGSIAHKAGVEGAKTGAMVAGGISVVTNMVAVIKGEKTAKKAIGDAIQDTSKGAVVGYMTSSAASGIGAVMRKSSSELCRVLAKNNVPSQVISCVMATGKTISSYLNGEISGEECFVELEEKGAGMIAGGYGAAAGQILIPIPVVGAVVGGMVGSALASSFYKPLKEAIVDARLSYEERIKVEAESKKILAQLEKYHQEIKIQVANHFKRQDEIFANAFFDMLEGENLGDADEFIGGANKITQELGGTVLYNNMAEFDAMMMNQGTIVL